MKKILIVSPVECYPNYYGNSARIASFVNFFKQRGMDFRYLHLPDRPFDPQPMLDMLGSSYIYRPYSVRKHVLRRLRYRAIQSLFMRRDHRLVKVDDFIQRSDIFLYRKVLSDYKPDVVFINYTYYSRLFLYTPVGVQKILDTHDSLYLRFKSLYAKGSVMNRFRIEIADEVAAINRADKVISIQSAEEQFFVANGCKSQLLTIGYSIPYCSMPMHAERCRLLYIGAKYPANENAIKHFLDDIWPALRLALPAIELYMAGSIGDIFDNRNALPEKVRVVGHVKDLKVLYEQIDIAVNPVREGSGLKIKNIEALSFGRPIVTTLQGAEGLSEFIENGLEVANSLGDWLQTVVKLVSDTNYYNAISGRIAKQLQRYNERNSEEMERLFD